ncbi:MAG: hypothetical protein M8860_10550 [marine benthic group bacterium]|jgi:hypothetical protein|nr:hypothetical protein [Gemmatimonadota bacterium]MCL7963275.1 hypothetical protein [Candidatus Carthagonibacter metallireducens]MCL7936965.1 hypothetical protein [Gemmatimonadota bacterium]MCL7956618.1 hypothetical protein [Gemmatimonadota bacterium]MCL7964686.1 hypothetical protein [Gemmatimonadota bacterium]
MAKPDHPHEVRLRMAMERALELPADERGEFLRWLRTADPELAAHVLVALADRDPDKSGDSAG